MIRNRRHAAIGAGLLAAGLVLLALLLFWPRPPVGDQLMVARADLADLPGWAADDKTAALDAFRLSCARFEPQPDGRSLGASGVAGDIVDWREVCAAAASVGPEPEAAHKFFEAFFVPFVVTNNGEAEGLFTGYYEPELQGRLEPDDTHRYPLYRRPDDLVQVDLGRFRADLAGRRIAGLVVDGHLRPYPDRAAIDTGALAGRGLEMVWVDNPIDAFFLHIQGSGRVKLAEGGEMRLGFDGVNGHAYRAIGRDLVASGAIEKDQVSMQSIRAWLAGHPDQASDIMAANPSFVFFRDLGPVDGGPLGAQGAALTAGRSLAVDRRYVPYGVPVWLATELPKTAESSGSADRPYQRLMIAQDTGGAIRGPVRGDVFFGTGVAAGEIAGRMRQPGRIWLLLPRVVAERRAKDSR